MLRLVLGNHSRDKLGIPIMHKVSEDMLDLSKLKSLNIQNLSMKNNNTQKIVLSFVYDKYLDRFWREPLKYIPLFQSAHAVATPDFSINEQMEFPEYLHGVYKNRWLGCLWQDCGILAVPTVGWTTEEWDDLSFSGIERESVVVISTLGSKSDENFFMRGYNEMIKRIAPPLVIVYGDILPEMTGKFIRFRYKDSFKPKDSLLVQEVLFDISPVFEIGG